MRMAIILVHYHTPELAASALQAVQVDAAATQLKPEVVVVDNGSTPEGAALLDGLGVRVLRPGKNRGYAGGINLGLAGTSAPLVAAMNCDVLVQRGCLRHLGIALEGGAAAAGPVFFWDDAQRFLLPPGELRTRRAAWQRARAQAGGKALMRARSAWRRRAQLCWTAAKPIMCHELSGALLAFRRDVWARVGPFDEAYRLYFEESDWLVRLRKKSLMARWVPQAKAVHLYAQSTAREPQAAAWFEESAVRFRKRHYGGPFAALLRRAHAGAASKTAAVANDLPSEPTPDDLRAAAWLEISPHPLGFPAAARQIRRGPQEALRIWREGIPADLRPQLAPGAYGLRLIDGSGEERAWREETVGG